MVSHFRAVKIADPVKQRIGGRQSIDFVVIHTQNKRDADMGEHFQQKSVPDMGIFSLSGAHEFPAGGHVEKQVPDGNIRALRGSGIPDLLDFSAENQNFGSRSRIRAIGYEAELRD